MAFKTDFVVIGLGRFGLSIVKTLLQEHKSVMVLDCDLEKINRIRDKVAFAAALDATDEDALCEVGIKNAEHVIVAMGSNFENGLLTTVALQQLGIKNITVKSSDETQSKVYRQLGIVDIVSPEIETGIKVARRLTHSSIQDFIELGTDLSVIKIEVLNEKLIHKTIVDANFREKFGANIIAITRDEKTFVPSAMEILQKGDLLYIIIHNKNLTKIEAFIGKNEK
ncbi:MAG TPA: TrkA family potassium uptake protein [Candidatus Caccosoma faecigallinarum]|jgi:trkA-N domain protein|uniref:TrkA family potassium uptake protein n=1 Tax=Candidatus Caccosoma faecigallinarum TaxID=2840720 RepID=A0A9D1G8T2_9FIRM|nr:trkA-N domain protein [Firmicutes bacterium CAG:631]HIT17654.1 TrkA family potassium uptake protein [Candidatus Caccosoma faecigallinarum]